MPLLDFIKTISPACHKVTELSFEQLKRECNVFRGVLKEFSIEQDKLYEKTRNKMTKQEIAGKKVIKIKKGNKMRQMTIFVLTLTRAKILKQIYLVAVTAGYSRTAVAYRFSSRDAIDRCHRKRMTTYRQASLTLLRFENNLTWNISFQQLLVKWNSKPDDW